MDERWITEWFEYGFTELCCYLAKYAAFYDWEAQGDF